MASSFNALSIAQAFVARSNAALETIDLRLVHHAEPERWHQVLARARHEKQDVPFINPAYLETAVTPQTVLFLELTSRHNAVVGVIACKLIKTADYWQEIASESIWRPARMVPSSPMQLCIDYGKVPAIAGRVTYFGGLWLRPDYRKIGLSSLLPQTMHAMAQIQFKPDWLCGSVLEDMETAKFPKIMYGYPHSVPTTQDQFHFPIGRRVSIFTSFMTTAEWIKRSDCQLSQNTAAIFDLKQPLSSGLNDPRPT